MRRIDVSACLSDSIVRPNSGTIIGARWQDDWKRSIIGVTPAKRCKIVFKGTDIVTPAREAELIAIFKEATRLETDFWDMGWRAGPR
jgi:hypothetical protein